jgi:hypothetical protein
MCDDDLLVNEVNGMVGIGRVVESYEGQWVVFSRLLLAIWHSGWIITNTERWIKGGSTRAAHWYQTAPNTAEECRTMVGMFNVIAMRVSALAHANGASGSLL